MPRTITITITITTIFTDPLLRQDVWNLSQKLRRLKIRMRMQKKKKKTPKKKKNQCWLTSVKVKLLRSLHQEDWYENGDAVGMEIGMGMEMEVRYC